MKNIDIRNLKWKATSSWEGLDALIRLYGIEFVSEETFDNYIKLLCSDFARELGMSNFQFRVNFEAENREFFSAKKNAYKSCSSISVKDLELFKELLRIPYIDKRPKSSVERLIDEFNKLSSDEKSEFIRKVT